MKAETLPMSPSTWGEGPVWWNSMLSWVDINGKKLRCWDPESGKEACFSFDRRIGFALPCRSGRWICGGDRGLFFFDPASGRVTEVANPEAARPANRFNDAEISPDGRLFAGTIATDREAGAANLYRLDPDLGLERVRAGVTNSNGIAWTPDGRGCYYIDTPTRRVLRFDYDSASGALRDPVTAVDTNVLIDASPDGMCADAEGQLWIAFCYGSCVMRIDPRDGSLRERVDLPCRGTTSCCFGGPDLRDLYITSGIFPDQPEAEAGRVFVLRNLPVPGLPQVAFAD
jgi:sugar lactone lactonase YvrE